jgi:hypothetical protein
MGTWACLDSNNKVVNTIIAENEEIALACSFTPRVIEYFVENPVGIGFTYLENGQWERPVAPIIEEPIRIISE